MPQKKPLRIELVLMSISVLIFGGFLVLVFFYFGKVFGKDSSEDAELNREYSYHYEMIVGNRNTALWEDVYEKAKEYAASEDSLLTLRKADWNREYDKNDYVDMCIAAGADGIILEYNGEAGLAEKIDEAAEKGIPVVTLMNDPNKSARLSFVGVNDYQMGQAYGASVAELVTEDTKDILILSNREKELEKNQLYARIYNAVQEKVGEGSAISVKEQNLISKSQFDVEEAVRNIFQSADGPPEILVCLDEVTTECAYQAMVDYNMVGDVSIIGYYASDVIMDAVDKGLIPITISMNADQIAEYSIEALTEFTEIGRTNAYYTVDLLITNNRQGSNGTA